MLVGCLISSCGEQALDRAGAIESFAVANPNATEAETTCVVDQLIEQYGLDGLETELSASPPASTFEESQFRYMFRCGIDVDVRSQIVEQLSEAGVADADAPCVADHLVEGLDDADIDVLLTGEITPGFNDSFYAAVEACGAL